MFSPKQLKILIGIVAAVIVDVIAVFYWSWGVPAEAPLTSGDRLAFASRWLLLPGLTLLAGIGMTANRRFLLPAAIDGERHVDNHSFEINLRYNQNTLEQVVLAVIAWTGLSLMLQPEQLGMIPRMAILFAAGRIAFWLGYLYAPWARAFGLGLTAYPTFVALVTLALEALR